MLWRRPPAGSGIIISSWWTTPILVILSIHGVPVVTLHHVSPPSLSWRSTAAVCILSRSHLSEHNTADAVTASTFHSRIQTRADQPSHNVESLVHRC